MLGALFAARMEISSDQLIGRIAVILDTQRRTTFGCLLADQLAG
jgi:hypothetical protein